MLRSILTVILAVAFVAGLSNPSAAASFEGRTGVGLQLGIHSVTNEVIASVEPIGVMTTADNSGFLGGVTIEHWVDPRWSIKLSISALAVEASSSTTVLLVETRTTTVASILFSAQYQFLATQSESPWRPYLALGVGPYIGSESATEVGTVIVTGSHNEQAIGGFAGAGVDVLLGKRFLLGMLVGFHGMTDFPEPVGGRKNYSGAAFSLNFSFLFGGN